MSDPAIALLEFDSVSAGIVAGDAMVKSSPVTNIYAGSVHPGKYLVLVSGDTATVEVAYEAGSEVGGGNIVASLFLADVHPDVTKAVLSGSRPLAGEALGIVETKDVASVIDAADAAAKTADIFLSTIRLADGLGGKGYVLISGSVAEVEAAVEAAVVRAEARGTLVRSDLVAQLAEEMSANLVADPLFLNRISV